MLVECKRCGAPLDVEGAAIMVKCTYCDATNKVRSLKTIAPSTPAGWAPPPVWQPPAQFHFDVSSPLVYHAQPVVKAVARVAGCSVAVGIALVLLFASAVVLAVVLVARRPGGPLYTWDGATPLECSGHEELHVEGVSVSLPGRTAITVSGNCTLELVNVRIAAQDGIRVNGNGRVTLRGSTIDATVDGIVATMNAHVELHDSQVRAGRFAIDAGLNAHADVRGGVLEGSPAPTRSAFNAEIRLLDGAREIARP